MSVIGADDLRVTHPCASDPEGPLDLHVLSMPPAFVLSQDQTLRCIRVFDALLCAHRLWLLFLNVIDGVGS